MDDFQSTTAPSYPGPEDTHQADMYMIEQVLATVRPLVQADGGDLELVAYDQGIVSVRLHGACVGCPISQYTLKLGVERALKDALPGKVYEVVQVP